MNKWLRFPSISVFALGLLMSPAVYSQADCSEEIAEIDRRIATGAYAEMNVQLARQMQASLQQMCGFMDEGTRAAMMESVEDILPTKSEEEKRAEQRARSAELKAAREARKRAEEEAERNKPPVSPVILAPPTAKSLNARLVDRDDIMYHLWIRDWDLYEGNLRVLYASFPDRTQFALPDWRFHVYVVVVTPTGEITQHHVTSRQASDHAALALRRGHDEILYERFANVPEEPRTLERWSVSGRRMTSSVDITDLEPVIDGERWQRPAFQVATGDGNALYAAFKGGDRTSQQKQLGWFKLSPEGRVMGGGSTVDIRDSVGSAGWFESNGGGAGLIVNVSPVEGVDLASGLQIPASEANSGAGMTAHVTREKRLLVVDADGSLDWMSVPIERDIMQLAGATYSQPTTMSQIQSAMEGQQQWMDSLTAKYDTGRSTNYINVGPHRIEMVKPTDRGAALLTTVTANRKLEPPIHGPYLVELDESGETSEIYLDALAEQLDVKLTTFAPAPGGGFYLHGTNRGTGDSHVILVDEQGDPTARGRTSYTAYDGGTNIEGIMADDSGVWLFGHAYRNRERARLWVERIEFNQ